MKGECPCKSCPNKGCGSYHDVCEKYLPWQAENEAENIRRQERYDAQFTSHPNKETALRKSMKRRK